MMMHIQTAAPPTTAHPHACCWGGVSGGIYGGTHRDGGHHGGVGGGGGGLQALIIFWIAAPNAARLSADGSLIHRSCAASACSIADSQARLTRPRGSEWPVGSFCTNA